MWDEMEKNEGASIDLLYNGPPDVDLLIEGKIRGQKAISVFQNKIGYDSPIQEYEAERRVNRRRRLISPVLMFASLVGMAVYLVRLKKETVLWKRRPLWGLVLCLLVIFVSSLAMYQLSDDPVPSLHFNKGPRIPAQD